MTSATKNIGRDSAAANGSPTEHLLAALWREVLQLSDPPQVHDDFFDLGGNSMTMVMTEFEILEQFGVQLPTGALLTAPTIRTLAQLLDAQLRDAQQHRAGGDPAAAG